MTTFFSPDIAEFRSWHVGLTEEKISDVALEGLWDVVKTLLGDGEGNFPYTESEVKPITYAALCHLATLQTDNNSQPGRVASAGEGSVSASFENIQTKSEIGAWWNLTKCGALFWVLTLKYRVGCKLYTGKSQHPWG